MLRMDMHVHTHASFDSLNEPDRVLRTAGARGIHRLVITDHNQIAVAQALQERDPERVLIGEEVKTAEGVDIIGILLRELIPRGTPARETCERIRGQGGVVYLPHPFDLNRSGGGRILERIADLVDVVEGHNARSWKPGLNARAAEWAAARGKPLGAGSDAHTLREIGRGWVEVPPFQATRDGLLGALRSGRIGAGCVTSSPMCHLWSTYAKVRKWIP